jgi:alkanesulfonate monooxygenase SsuD/methylene tetrahydromethanopterin reductase-like flavin-dependent oxidoreductase (luciferase family)
MTKPYAVYAGLSFFVVPADTTEDARAKALEVTGLTTKPYLARDWNIRPATPEEVNRYAAMADAKGKSRPTAASAKNPPKSVKGRLL